MRFGLGVTSLAALTLVCGSMSVITAQEQGVAQPEKQELVQREVRDWKVNARTKVKAIMQSYDPLRENVRVKNVETGKTHNLLFERMNRHNKRYVLEQWKASVPNRTITGVIQISLPQDTVVDLKAPGPKAKLSNKERERRKNWTPEKKKNHAAYQKKMRLEANSITMSLVKTRKNVEVLEPVRQYVTYNYDAENEIITTPFAIPDMVLDQTKGLGFRIFVYHQIGFNDTPGYRRWFTVEIPMPEIAPDDTSNEPIDVGTIAVKLSKKDVMERDSSSVRIIGTEDFKRFRR